MIKALIFDMDGVIIDSEPIHFESDKMTLREYGIEITDDVLNNYVGVANPVMWAELIEIYSLDCTVDELLQKQLKYKFELFGTKSIEAIDGIPELIESLKLKGIKVGLASSSSRVFIELILMNLGITGYFDAIVSGEDVSKSKPEPDIFIKAATLLEVEPDECLVIEDSGHGVKAAKSAGMRCIGYANVNSGNQDLSMADFCVDSIRDISEYIKSLGSTTNIYFVRHAQPDISVKDDTMHPLTEKGLADSKLVTEALKNKDFREWKVDNVWVDDFITFSQKQWDDFSFKMECGECLKEVQERNISALNEVLKNNPGRSVLIHKADRNDIDCIEKIYNESIDWLNSQGIPQWKRGVYPTRESALDAVNEDCLYCCTMDGNICGTFIINENQSKLYEDLDWRYKVNKILVLHTLVIKPGETGRGIGKTIMEFILNYARENNYEAIRLDAFPDNKAAVRLYLHYGFEYVGKVFFDFKEPGYEWYDCFEKLISSVT